MQLPHKDKKSPAGRGISLFIKFNRFLAKFKQFGNIIDCGIPNDLKIHILIAMHNTISHTIHLIPMRLLRSALFKFLG